MPAGGTTQKDDPELAMMWAVVARAIRLSPARNAATDTGQIRQLLGELLEDYGGCLPELVPCH